MKLNNEYKIQIRIDSWDNIDTLSLDQFEREFGDKPTILMDELEHKIYYYGPFDNEGESSIKIHLMNHNPKFRDPSVSLTLKPGGAFIKGSENRLVRVYYLYTETYRESSLTTRNGIRLKAYIINENINKSIAYEHAYFELHVSKGLREYDAVILMNHEMDGAKLGVPQTFDRVEYDNIYKIIEIAYKKDVIVGKTQSDPRAPSQGRVLSLELVDVRDDKPELVNNTKTVRETIENRKGHIIATNDNGVCYKLDVDNLQDRYLAYNRIAFDECFLSVIGNDREYAIVFNENLTGGCMYAALDLPCDSMEETRDLIFKHLSGVDKVIVHDLYNYKNYLGKKYFKLNFQLKGKNICTR